MVPNGRGVSPGNLLRQECRLDALILLNDVTSLSRDWEMAGPWPVGKAAEVCFARGSWEGIRR
jgi:hypothetical protein